jgi:hypothetical protein
LVISSSPSGLPSATLFGAIAASVPHGRLRVRVKMGTIVSHHLEVRSHLLFDFSRVINRTIGEFMGIYIFSIQLSAARENFRSEMGRFPTFHQDRLFSIF